MLTYDSLPCFSQYECVQARDAKFGFGGNKNNGRSKRNDSASFHEGKFNVAKNKALPRGVTAGKSKAGKSNKRPGKSKRQSGGRK